MSAREHTVNEGLAEVIDQAEKGLLPGTNATEAWQDRVAYGVLTSGWLAAYVAAREHRAVREALAPVRALADRWDALAEISEHDRAYVLVSVADDLRAALPDDRTANRHNSDPTRHTQDLGDR